MLNSSLTIPHPTDNSSDIVILMVKSQFASSERRFSKSTLIQQLRKQLEPITGKVISISLNNQVLDDNRLLGFYSPQDYDVLQVQVEKTIDYNNVDLVEKLVMDDKDYDKRTDSVRAFKKKLGLGRFAKTEEQPNKDDEYKEIADSIKVNDRCRVGMGTEFVKYGTVKFVGKTEFKKGYWVGVEYDEPYGKNDGSKDSVVYFKAKMGYGAFLRPDAVEVGDFEVIDEFEEEF